MQKLYTLAKDSLGKDIAKTQNDLGCAEAVSYLLLQLNISDFPKKGFLSTIDLYKYLSKSPNFKLINDYKKGAIIISPTSGKKIGHCGVVGTSWIMSNNSLNGLFQATHNIKNNTWKNFYEKKLGLKTYFFEII